MKNQSKSVSKSFLRCEHGGFDYESGSGCQYCLRVYWERQLAKPRNSNPQASPRTSKVTPELRMVHSSRVKIVALQGSRARILIKATGKTPNYVEQANQGTESGNQVP